MSKTQTKKAANKSAKSSASSSGLRIRAIRQVRLVIPIRGTSPMIQNAWSTKGLTMLRMTAQERKKVPKVSRDPQKEAMDACYLTEDGNFGVPARALKACVIGAAHKDLGVERTLVKKALFVTGDIIAMECGEPKVREDVVKVGMNQTDLRYRPEFWPWTLEASFIVDAELLSLGDVVQLLNRAGFSIGLMEWRPDKGGDFGRFEVDTTRKIREEEV